MRGMLLGLPEGDGEHLPCLLCIEFVTLPGFIGNVCNLAERTGRPPGDVARSVIQGYHDDQHPLSLLVHALTMMLIEDEDDES